MKKFLILLLAASMLLGMFAGCGGKDKEETIPATETTEPVVKATVPPDGNPDDVTCKGTYTGEMNSDQVVARSGKEELTNGLLQAFYWAQVAAYRQANYDVAPDFDLPLDTQICPIDDSVNSWQQFFLKGALNAWHTAQALKQQGADEGLSLEEAFQPNMEDHAENMTDMPANRVLYGYYDHFVPNSMHQAYLDSIPAMLEALAAQKGHASANAMAGEAFGTRLENLENYVNLLNFGYMYFTNLSYEIAPTAEEVEAWAEERGIAREGETYVDFRQILVLPQENTMEAAENLFKQWRQGRFVTEASFAEFANKNSMDPGSAPNGGAYRQVRRGQLDPKIEEWCFSPERQYKDTAIIETDQGCHILYFCGATESWRADARQAMIREAEEKLLADAREKYPIEVSYADITLNEANGDVGTAELLYPDVAHERFPEAPLYVQQDYPKTKYGAYPIRTHGCGPTTLAMLASYMTDELYTPPRIAKLYGKYCHVNGTDGIMFNYTPAEMGFYLREKVYNPGEARKALEDGYLVVTVQSKGFWTRGGHYLLLEKQNEDGRIQVRDSNLLNYGRLEDHKRDSFDWETIPPKAKGYWVYEHKVKTIAACSRCGQSQGLIQDGYICEKCTPAVMRRDVYLNVINGK